MSRNLVEMREKESPMKNLRESTPGRGNRNAEFPRKNEHPMLSEPEEKTL